jgi:excisionase family DNA binding protein
MQTNTEQTADASDVLDVPQVARLLRVGRNTVYALVARNGIPHRRLGKAIRFSRVAVMSWLSTSWQVAKEGE